MERCRQCDGCAALQFERWPQLHVALCCDPEKPALGRRRVVAVSTICNPSQIDKPAWCRGKE